MTAPAGPGDITLVEYAGGSSESYNYCVALFHDRVRDDAPTADVRHILIGAADANITPTEEQYEQAKAKAEELLAQWEAGDATEDSFAQLAQENSADTSSASNGGCSSMSLLTPAMWTPLPSGPWTPAASPETPASSRTPAVPSRVIISCTLQAGTTPSGPSAPKTP